MTGRWLPGCLVVLTGAVGTVTARAAEIGPEDDLAAAIDAMVPGDTLVLRGGTYLLADRLSIQLACSAASPCAIRAKPGEVPHLHRPNQEQNIVDVEWSTYLTLAGLEMSGGSRGMRLRDSSFITVEDCHIHDTGDAALTANDGGSTYQGLQLRRNHIHHTDGTGEGMYLGCNFDGCRVRDSVIEGNYIHHTDGPTVVQGDGIEIKEGSFGNALRDNVIHDTNYPCILVDSAVGNGAANLIAGNLLWGCGDHGIQVTADAVVRNNILLGAVADGIATQPHQNGVPANLLIAHNTVLAPSNDAFRASGVAGELVVANNAFYSAGGAAIRLSGDLAQTALAGNVGEGSLVGASGGFVGGGDLALDFAAAGYSGSLPQDLFPTAGSLLVGAADGGWLAADDFNGTPRVAPGDAGAYRYAPGGNPGWPLSAGFKPLPLLFADGFESGDTSAWSVSN